MRQFPKTYPKEFNVFKKLTTPIKVQDFIENIPINFELRGETYRSPLLVLKENKAHCMEGALLAAAIFWFHGKKPLLLDFQTHKDEDHVVTLFKEHNRWGAISKTNHAILRYRDPIYKTVRELALSYFNEYFLDNGVKTLRRYSNPFSLLRYGVSWLTAEEDLFHIVNDLDASFHYDILDKNMARNLRKTDAIEIKMMEFTHWKKQQSP